MAPQEVYIVIQRTCDNVTSQGTADFANRLNDLELVRFFLDDPGGLSGISEVLKSREGFLTAVRGR